MITEFAGEHRWLSNFWPCKIVDRQGKEYASVEHAYAACKCARPEDAEQVRLAPTPGQAKRLARKLPIRPGWDDMKVGVMRRLLVQKFAVGSELATRLLATSDEWIEEGNTWGDTFWGVCNGCGHNTLGRLLMERRDELAKAVLVK